jgi:orotidine-5'-phosphate decarboxylase
VRAIVGDMPILVPGIGAQGGDINAVVRAGTTHPSSTAAPSRATTPAGTTSPSSSATTPATSRRGLIINSSRAILYASDCADFASAARDVALTTRAAITAAS